MTDYTMRVWHGKGGRYAAGSRSLKFHGPSDPDDLLPQAVYVYEDSIRAWHERDLGRLWTYVYCLEAMVELFSVPQDGLYFAYLGDDKPHKNKVGGGCGT